MLLALKQIHPLNSIIEDIWERKHNSIYTGKEIFIWIPPHVGISGNEWVDAAAKQVIDVPVIQIPIPFNEF